MSQLKRKNIVSSGVRTHAHIRGPEHSTPFTTGRIHLESGALDHSAMLTAERNEFHFICLLLVRKSVKYSC